MKTKTKAEQIAKIEADLAAGKIDVNEAEQQYQDLMHTGEDTYLSVYGW